MSTTDRQFLVVGDALPTSTGDGVGRPFRGTRRGEMVSQVLGKDAYAYADEGSYFVARNPTIGTGIAGIAAADGAEGLENLLYVENGHATKRIYLDYLRLVPTVAGASGTTCVFVSATSPTARYTSGAAAISGPSAVNPAAGVASSAIIKFGALITTAVPAAGAVVGGGSLRLGVAKVIGDIYLFDFGGYRQNLPPLVTSGTAQAFVPWRHAPVVLGPGHCFTLEVYAASQAVTGASFEFELGYVER